MLQLSAEVAPGASGSPVVNMKCELLGIGAGRFNTEHSVNFAIPASEIARLHHHDPVPLRQWSLTAAHHESVGLPVTPPGMSGTESRHQIGLQDGFKRAMVLFDQDKFAEAGKAFERLVDADPNMVDAWYHLRLCEEHFGHIERAFRAFENAGDLKRNDKDIRLHLGGTLKAIGRYKDAFNQFQEAIRLDSSFGEAWLGMAQGRTI